MGTATYRHRIAAAIAGLLLLIPLSATALDPDRSILQYKHTAWGRAEGAPSPVNDIVQTADGYLWLATGAGLFRFDGIGFERIDTAFDIAVEGPPVQLLIARNGDLWVSYLLSEKFAIYRGGKLRVVPSPPANGQVVDFAQTPDGAIWAAIGQIGQPMMRYAKGAWSRVDPTAGSGRKSSYDTIVTADGALWVSYNDAVYRLRPGAARFERLLSKPRGRMRIVLDHAGRVWLTDVDGSRAITGPGGRWTGRPLAVPYPGDNFRRRGKTVFDKDGNLWIARRRDGVERLRTPSATGASAGAAAPPEYRASDGLTSDTTHKIFEDREGNIWVGTAQGLDRFRNANIAIEPALTKPAAYGDILFADAQGAVYIGQRDAIYRAAPGGSPEVVLSGVDEPEAICEGPDRAIWIVLSNEIVILRGARQQRIALPDGLETGIYDCGMDRSGRFWMTAAGSGIYRRVGDGWVNRPAKLPYQFYPTQMVRDAPGDLWLMWGRGAVARLDAQGPTLIDAPPKDVMGELRTITPWGSGLLLAGDRAIARLDRSGLAVATIEQIPALARASGVVQTPAGETWIFGEFGVSRVKTADIERAFGDRRLRVQAQTFGFLDGLPDLRARARNRGLVRGGDGRLWAATEAGTVWIDPARLWSNTAPPKVAIGSLTAGNRRYLDPVSPRLPAGTSSMAIGFAALSLGMPEKVQVRYRLEGQDRGWIDPGVRRQAFYTNLRPGAYRFRVIAANEGGVWNRQGATLDLTILPTFLQSIWFKLLLLLALSLLLAAIYVFRGRYVTERLQQYFNVRISERERIARELHDTLLQGFQGLVLRFDAVAKGLPSGHSSRAALESALDRADAVLVEGRARILGLRSQDPVADLATTLLDGASQLIGPNDPRAHLTQEGASRILHPVMREEVERIAEEAVRNAVNHARASKIEILLHWGRRDFGLAIRDDGAGMPAATLVRGELTGHFGLIGMRERAHRIGGRLVVTSAQGAGTEVALTLPARAAYRDHPMGLLDRLRGAKRTP